MHDLVLSGSMAPYVWTINGDTYDRAEPLMVQAGPNGAAAVVEHVDDDAPCPPARAHVPGGAGRCRTGPRKDTVLLAPMTRAEVDLVADNPGSWMLHCHNAYHAEAGMMTRLDYTT
ncbi:MAG: multicopper oxidase domain-containing protein [Candidatus Nanopelagicales bacterium]